MGNTRDQWTNDPESTMRIALQSMRSNLWTSLPAIVKAVNYEENTVTVQPAIMGEVSNDDNTTEFVALPLLIHCPIKYPRGGGFMLSFPISVGDEGLVVFASRCIDSWWDLGGVQVPAEVRFHDLSDGCFLPGVCSKPNAIADIITTAIQMRTLDGLTFVSVTNDGKVKLKASAIEIDGNVAVTGNINATGEVAAHSGGTPVHLSTHTHSGVTPGGGASGPPTPGT